MIGFNIGALHASVLMLSKDFSNKGVHSNGRVAAGGGVGIVYGRICVAVTQGVEA